MKKFPQKSAGAYAATMVKRLKKSGLKGPALVMAIAAIKGENGGGQFKTKPLPRRIIKRIAEMVAETGRAVIVRGKTGVFKVYSLDGHTATRNAVRKHKPWEKSSRSDVPAPEAAVA